VTTATADPNGVLRPPAGASAVPSFDAGWRLADGTRAPFLSYVDDGTDVHWSDQLEDLHEESSRTHFIDRWTRAAILERLGEVPEEGLVADLGCSTGYLLEDLRAAHSNAHLIGVDLVAPGLRKAHGLLPDAWLVRADVCTLPIADDSVDAVVSANLLEHVPDDEAALAEIHRVLKPGARAVVVVPAGPGTFDYYDRFLGHQRRYGRGEMAGKARVAGFEVLEDTHLGAPLYPAFWAVKKLNRLRFDHLRGAELEERVAADIAKTQDSSLGALACRLERSLLRRRIRPPFGIRGLTVLRRPEEAG
jgi:SAM-dependent methyltransferase